MKKVLFAGLMIGMLTAMPLFAEASSFLLKMPTADMREDLMGVLPIETTKVIQPVQGVVLSEGETTQQSPTLVKAPLSTVFLHR